MTFEVSRTWLAGAKASLVRRLTLSKRLCYFYFGRFVGRHSEPCQCLFESLPSIIVITGFNTDIEHNRVVYHVQTEDKGLATPFILSLVYVGGAILASKRTPYNDLVASGFDAEALAERLQRQHKLICAAINAGRIDDLKRMAQREGDERAPPRTDAPPPAPQPPITTPPADQLETPAEKKAVKSATDFSGGVAQPEPTRVALHLSLLEEKELYAGEVVTLRVRVSRGADEHQVSVANAAVTVKVLGSEFRPLILTTQSDEDGVATVHAWLPRFTAGRAAILIRAVANGYEAELRRLIHHV